MEAKKEFTVNVNVKMNNIDEFRALLDELEDVVKRINNFELEAELELNNEKHS